MANLVQYYRQRFFKNSGSVFPAAFSSSLPLDPLPPNLLYEIKGILPTARSL